ncbi:MAG: sulfatase-like hydrolase/transferase [Chitinophagaceae bacterium]|nr:sulfatase-like hydrolase/transferase [Chitinophagaceae bacterium]
MLTNKSFYPFLFIIFYLLSNTIEVREIISFAYFFSTLSFCLTALLLLAACCYPFYKSWKKCFLFAFAFLFFYLQYGSIHESLLSIKVIKAIAHHTVLIIITFILLSACFIIIKKLKINEKLILTLNIIYVFLTLFILTKLIYLSFVKKELSVQVPAWVNTQCDTCRKPDIYLLVYDEYASSISLKRRFNFDNSFLDSFLLAEKFHIQTNSSSNYNATDCSMLSFFSADYLSYFKTKNYYTKEERIDVLNDLKKTNFINYLQNNQYNIYNYSIFSLLKNDTQTESSPIFTSHLLLAKALHFKLLHDAGSIIIKYKLYRNILRRPFYRQRDQMELLKNNFLNKINNTKENNSPSFYYLHQLSPHDPFYYDRNDNDATFNLPVTEQEKTQAYLEYVQYCNKKIVEIITQIKKISDNNAVIIFMGDHGYRMNLPAVNNKEHFANQNAIYFPDKDYNLLYDSMSNVNISRVLLNKYFNMGLPLLKDSSIYIK